MDRDQLRFRIRECLTRDLLLDLLDAVSARALQAHEVIRDHTDLTGRSARGLEGQARFRLMEKGFQDTCETYGAQRLEGDLIPETDLRVYQPFMRFGTAGSGVVLALASMPAPHEMPAKNRSREAGVSLNICFTPQLDLGDVPIPKPGDVFVLFLTARDRSHAGQLEEVAIGVIDGSYGSFVIYEPLEGFLGGYGIPTPGDGGPPTPLVKLRHDRRAFQAPEVHDEGIDEDKQSS